MLFALGAASSAIDALMGLTSSKSAQSNGSSQWPVNPFALSPDASAPTGASSGSGGGSTISPETMSALIAAQGQSSQGSAPTSRADALKDLFKQIDADGDGQISKAEFENALGAGGTNIAKADDVFNKLDKDGNGSVSLDEMSSALRGGKGHHHHAAHGSGNAQETDPLLQALQGASGTSVTNSDGSTTTSLTYADGSKVTMVSPASSSVSGAATSSYNFIEQMIAREAKEIASRSAPALSVSA